MSPTISRRAFTAGSVATILGGGTVLSIPLACAGAAQRSNDLASLGLPALDITVTPDVLEGMPAEIEAGRYLLTVTLAEGVEFGAAAFVQPPAGMTAEDFLAELGFGSTAPPASPPAVDASPQAEEEEGLVPEVLPTFVYQTRFAGGLYAEAGTSGEVVIDLDPGDWILWPDDPEASQQPVTFTVTGEMPADLPEPEADITATLIDFGIAVEGDLTAGEHVMRIENQGAQPHFLEVLKGPDRMTNEQLTRLLDLFVAGSEATPPDIDWDVEADLLVNTVLSTATQSLGTVMWTNVTLDAGTYAAFCFFPTAGEGLPHAVHGMHTVFKVT